MGLHIRLQRGRFTHALLLLLLAVIVVVGFMKGSDEASEAASKVKERYRGEPEITEQYYNYPDLYGPLSMEWIRHGTKKSIGTPLFLEKLRALRKFEQAIAPRTELDLNVTEDPLKLIVEQHPNPKEYTGLPRKQRAMEYAYTILPQTGYHFAPVKGFLYEDMSERVSDRMKDYNELRKSVNDEDLDQLGITGSTLEDMIFSEWNYDVTFNKDYARFIDTALSHLRIFSSIFLRFPEPFNDDEMEKACSAASEAIFPWFTGEFPRFTQFDHETGEFKEVQRFKEQKGCFVKSLQTQLTGRGITVTAADPFVPTLLGLLATLRTIETDPLPMQIVYEGDQLSVSAMKRIVEAATGNPDQFRKAVEHKDGGAIPVGININPPSIDVTFVDVTRSVTKDFMQEFGGWGHKLLAYLFNSFAESVIMDTDAVPLKPLQEFFDSNEYQTTNTFFFNDREMTFTVSSQKWDMLQSCWLGKRENEYLNMFMTPEYTKSRTYKYMLKDRMEAGIVLVDRRKRFDGVLLAFQMQTLELFRSCFHGDKEFFWLAQEYMGQPYKFNSWGAGSAGELYDPNRNDVHTVCSTHPAHFTDDLQSLYWINSGFLFCKNQETCEEDADKGINKGLDKEAVKKKYLAPITIRAGVVPPTPPFEEPVTQKEGYPTQEWVQRPECHKYLRCASDLIGDPGQGLPTGHYVKFAKSDCDRWDYLGKVWTESYGSMKVEE